MNIAGVTHVLPTEMEKKKKEEEKSTPFHHEGGSGE